jgi:putative membrane protein
VRLLLRWAVAASAVAAAAWLVPGIHVEGGIPALLGIALLLGLVNALVRPFLRWLACGIIFLTLVLFLVVINALMLLLTELLARLVGIGFSIDSFTAAVLGALVISATSFIISILLPDLHGRRRRTR